MSAAKVNIAQWLETHKASFQPPVSNKLMFVPRVPRRAQQPFAKRKNHK